MAWLTPKIDWSQTDFINYADWNRIENNIRELANYLNSIYYTIPSFSTVTTRTITHIDDLNSINRIESNLESIRANFVTPTGYKGYKSWVARQPFTSEDANRLEENVKLLMEYSLLVFDSFKYCGTLSCNEEGVIF